MSQVTIIIAIVYIFFDFFYRLQIEMFYEKKCISDYIPPHSLLLHMTAH